jgi:hypothetical protein
MSKNGIKILLDCPFKAVTSLCPATHYCTTYENRSGLSYLSGPGWDPWGLRWHPPKPNIVGPYSDTWLSLQESHVGRCGSSCFKWIAQVGVSSIFMYFIINVYPYSLQYMLCTVHEWISPRHDICYFVGSKSRPLLRCHDCVFILVLSADANGNTKKSRIMERLEWDFPRTPKICWEHLDHLREVPGTPDAANAYRELWSTMMCIQGGKSPKRPWGMAGTF